MRKIKLYPVCFLIIVMMMVLAGCVGAGGNSGQVPETKVELTVSAAASLTDAMKEIQAGYEKRNGSIRLNLNFGASGSLQQQIEQGAPVDLFISAAVKNMKALVDQQLIDAERHTVLLTNELVLVVPAASAVGALRVEKPEDLTRPEIKHIAIGEP